MSPLYLQAVALFAPGIESWQAALPLLRGEGEYRPTPLPRPSLEWLPPQERRRCSASTRLALQVAQASLAEQPCSDPFAAIFSSANGDTEIHQHICSAFCDPQPQVSPTRFHNSVHNAPAGYWSIANQSRSPTNSIAAYDGSFAAGLLAAACQVFAERRRVLLAAYDLPFPAPLDQQRPISAPFAVALQLTPTVTRASLFACRVETLPATTAPTTTLASPPLEALRVGNPAARALPLLALLARGQAGEVTLDYLDGLAVRLALTPC